MDPVSSEISYGALRVLLSNRQNHSKRTERSCRVARKLPSPNGSSRRFGSITSGNYCGRGVSRNLRLLEPTGCSEQAWLTASGWRGADINERTCRRTDAPPSLGSCEPYRRPLHRGARSGMPNALHGGSRHSSPSALRLARRLALHRARSARCESAWSHSVTPNFRSRRRRSMATIHSLRPGKPWAAALPA
jgi:hypothetical protein